MIYSEIFSIAEQHKIAISALKKNPFNQQHVIALEKFIEDELLGTGVEIHINRNGNSSGETMTFGFPI